MERYLFDQHLSSPWIFVLLQGVQGLRGRPGPVGDMGSMVSILLVSFAAVIRVVMQCSSPTNGCSLELCIPFLKLTNKQQASISWKPGPLTANVTRNMIGAAANSYMHVVGSQ